MEIRVPYGQGHVTVEVAPHHLAGIVCANDVGIGDEDETLARALGSPLASPSLGRFLSGAGSLAVIVNDGTRPTPTARILGHIRGDLDQVKDLRLVVATGAHVSPTEPELTRIFGDALGLWRDRIFVHDARRSDDLVPVGSTPRGTAVALNRHVVSAERTLVIGSVEPHYFAGYTGGRKSLIPGVAARGTIEQNHRHALSRAAQPRALSGNPVHEDMVDAVRLLDERSIFSVQTVLDGDGRIYAATAGDIHESFYAAAAKAQDVYSVEIRRKADVVVAVAEPPLDVNLYQAHKAIEHAKLALKEGGALILVAECRGGIGDEAFVEALREFDEERSAVPMLGEDGDLSPSPAASYRLGHHKAAQIADLARWAEVIAVTSLDESVFPRAFLRPCPDLQRALDAALAARGRDAEVLFIMAASTIVPRVV
jgi:nickel-dependent lactate racemase